MFDWLRLPAATAWGWVLQPSAGYIGQGMIMGPKTAWSMFAGALTGWAVLGPLARQRGWAPGPIKDVETGAAGWLMWLGLALLLGDCFSELALLLGSALCDKAAQKGWLGAARALQQQQQQQRWRPHTHASAAPRPERHSGSPRLRARTASSKCLSGGSGCLLELSNSSSGSNLAGSPRSLVDAAPATADGAGRAGMQHAPPAAAGLDAGAAGADPQGLQSAATAGPLPRLSEQPSGGGSKGGAPGRGSSAAAAAGSGDPKAWLLSVRFWVPGLVLSTALATAVLSPMMSMPVYEPLVAVAVALLVALLAVRSAPALAAVRVSAPSSAAPVVLLWCALHDRCAPRSLSATQHHTNPGLCHPRCCMQGTGHDGPQPCQRRWQGVAAGVCGGGAWRRAAKPGGGRDRRGWRTASWRLDAGGLWGLLLSG